MARAPGRLDVVGGIADYSGSLVLQVDYFRCFCLIVIGGHGISLYKLDNWDLLPRLTWEISWTDRKAKNDLMEDALTQPEAEFPWD